VAHAAKAAAATLTVQLRRSTAAKSYALFTWHPSHQL